MKADLSVDMSDAVQGVYFMNIVIGNQSVIRRIVKM